MALSGGLESKSRAAWMCAWAPPCSSVISMLRTQPVIPERKRKSCIHDPVENAADHVSRIGLNHRDAGSDSSLATVNVRNTTAEEACSARSIRA